VGVPAGADAAAGAAPTPEAALPWLLGPSTAELGEAGWEWAGGNAIAARSHAVVSMAPRRRGVATVESILVINAK
ncbi:hypothetical protein, partial [Cupriavidus gilardii]